MALLLLCLSFSPQLLPLDIWIANSSLPCCKFQPRTWSLPWTQWSQNIPAVTKERMKCETTYVDLWSKLNPEQTLNGVKAPSSPGSSFLFTCSGSKAFHPGVTLFMVISVMLTGQLPRKSHQCPLCPKCWDEHTKPWRVTIQVCWWREQMKQISRARSSCLNKTTVLTSTTLRRQTTETTICGSTCLHLCAAQHMTLEHCQSSISCCAQGAPSQPSAAAPAMLSSGSERHLLQRSGCWCSAHSHILRFALENSKANLVHHTAAGCWVLSPSSRWDEFHQSALCAHQRLKTPHWDLPAAAKEKNMWDDPPQKNSWNFWHGTHSISKHLWKRK